jgi:hypothetical protein
MNLNPLASGLTLAGLLLLTNGCQEANSPTSAPMVAPAPLSPDTVLRMHWVGKHSLGVAASAYSLMQLWELPETKQLQSYALARLSAALSQQAAAGSPPDSNMALDMIMDDFVDKEWFFEVREDNKRVNQWAAAIRVDTKRVEIWRNNSAWALSRITGVHPTMNAAGWKLIDPRTQKQIEFKQVNGWTVIGVAAGPNSLFDEMAARIGRDGSPGGWARAGSWLEVQVDLNWAAIHTADTTERQNTLPKLNLSVTGDGAHVVTEGVIDFPNALNPDLAAWTVPDKELPDSMAGFTALRGEGIEAWWPLLGLGAAPEQLFTWAGAGAPAQMRFAAKYGAAAPTTNTLSQLIGSGNAWLSKNGIGQLAALPGTAGFIWQGLPVFTPFVRLAEARDGWLLGGTMTNAAASPAPTPVYPRPSVREHLAALQAQSNLVAYAWETTGARAESFYMLGQVSRVARLHPQMSQEALSAKWIQSVRQRLGNSTTTIALTGTNQLTFKRKSATGFTAAELHLLSDWIESPDFPRGLYSTRTRRAASAAEFQTQP